MKLRTVIWSQGECRPGTRMGQHRTVVHELTDDDVDWVDSTAHDSPGPERRAVLPPDPFLSYETWGPAGWAIRPIPVPGSAISHYVRVDIRGDRSPRWMPVLW